MTEQTPGAIMLMGDQPGVRPAPKWARRFMAFGALFIVGTIALRAAFGPEIPANNTAICQTVIAPLVAFMAWYVLGNAAPDLLASFKAGRAS